MQESWLTKYEYSNSKYECNVVKNNELNVAYVNQLYIWEIKKQLFLLRMPV